MTAELATIANGHEEIVVIEPKETTNTMLTTLRLFTRNLAYRWQERAAEGDEWMTPVEARRRLLAPEEAQRNRQQRTPNPVATPRPSRA